jgi:hypothetical protein
LDTSILLVGNTLLVVDSAGVLTTEIRLVGDALLVVTTAGALTTEILLLGTAALVVVTAADLTGGAGTVVFRKVITVLEFLKSDVSRG